MARGLIQKVEELYYLCSENKGADQLRDHGGDMRLCFRICKTVFHMTRLIFKTTQHKVVTVEVCVLIIIPSNLSSKYTCNALWVAKNNKVSTKIKAMAHAAIQRRTKVNI